METPGRVLVLINRSWFFQNQHFSTFPDSCDCGRSDIYMVPERTIFYRQTGTDRNVDFLFDPFYVFTVKWLVFNDFCSTYLLGYDCHFHRNPTLGKANPLHYE